VRHFICARERQLLVKQHPDPVKPLGAITRLVTVLVLRRPPKKP